MRRSNAVRHAASLLCALGLAAVPALGAGQPAGPDRAADARPGARAVPDEWLEGTPEARARRFRKLKPGQDPPPLKLSQWKNGRPVTFADLKGKVVLLDFWATWCAPCLASIPHQNDLYDRYKADGLLILGVCQSQGAETMADTVDERRIKYPVAADVDGATVEAFAVDGFPDYYFIDRSGKLRILDCKNANVEDAIKLLLAEKAE